MDAFHVNICIDAEATQFGAAFTGACLAPSTSQVGIFIERIAPSQSYIDPSRFSAFHLSTALPFSVLRHRRRSKSSCPHPLASDSRPAVLHGEALARATVQNRGRALSIGGPAPVPRPLQLPFQQLLRRSRERSRLTLHAFVRALASRVSRLSGSPLSAATFRLPFILCLYTGIIVLLCCHVLRSCFHLLNNARTRNCTRA